MMHDMLSSILDVVASIFGQMGERALVVNTELHVEKADGAAGSGNIIMLPDPNNGLCAQWCYGS